MVSRYRPLLCIPLRLGYLRLVYRRGIRTRPRAFCLVQRGWTLQELITPMKVPFFVKSWRMFGTKHGLGKVISRITNIKLKLLQDANTLHEFSVAQKMSWAAFRETTRSEDRAYSLFGLFGITGLPAVYGDGHRPFLRLQVEIMRLSPDHSLFA